MKTLPISLLLVLPLIGWSQEEDYCPCMDFRNDYNRVADYSSSVEHSSNQFTTTQQVVPLNQAFGMFIPELPPEPAEPPAEASAAEAEQADRVPEPSSRRSAVKRSKKRKRGRIKARKKARKYRGQCPMFMP
ncbi:MAG: hypothetical protein AAF990_13645 [Bacteroidota bacterium]